MEIKWGWGRRQSRCGRLCAKKKYKASLDYVVSEYKMSEEDKSQAKALKTAIHLNLAACHLRTGDWRGVVRAPWRDAPPPHHTPRGLGPGPSSILMLINGGWMKL